MKETTRLMIKLYNIDKLGYDFMGYSLQKGDRYTYHHMIKPARENGKITIENGAILCGLTSHPYFHLVESKDPEIARVITSQMIDMNQKGYLDIHNLKCINDALKYFEREHCNDRGRKGKLLIKNDYLKRKKF